jgi:hypothetical protein
MRRMHVLVLASMAASLTSCRRQPPDVHAPGIESRRSIVKVEPLGREFRAAAGQNIYVPAYPSILISDNANAFELAVTLSIRNTDPNRPIVLNTVDYYDHDGELVRHYLDGPVRIGPRASVEYFVAERDTRGGVSASFSVEWVSAEPVSSPIVEAVMAGTANNQGLSFVCPGRVLDDRAASSP